MSEWCGSSLGQMLVLQSRHSTVSGETHRAAYLGITHAADVVRLNNVSLTSPHQVDPELESCLLARTRLTGIFPIDAATKLLHPFPYPAPGNYVARRVGDYADPCQAGDDRDIGSCCQIFLDTKSILDEDIASNLPALDRVFQQSGIG